MAIEIQTLGRERTGELLGPLSVTMGFEPPAEVLEEFSRLPEYELRLAALDGREIVGALGSLTFEMTTPGGSVQTAGLTGVGVYPTHRRRGILRRLMRRYLDGVHEQQQPVSALWASEAPIYGRFGYGVASVQGGIELDLQRASFVPAPELEASFRFLDADEALEAFPRIYDAMRAETPGMLSRSNEWWKARRLGDGEWARRGPVLDVAGEPAAYALYRQTHEWQNGVPGGAVHLNEAVGSSPAATRAVWRYLCDLDLMEKLMAWMLPVDHPLLLLVSEPRRLRFRLGDALWVRVVDVAAARGARRYGDGGAVVLDLRDPFCEWNTGRWRVRPERTERTGDSADIALDVAGLGSVYLGGFTFADLARAGLAEELSDGAVARADALFVRDRAPWCAEIF